ncbi:hypothetical protein FA15DRAFT_657216 [Coprinopsis marcescibilis]|uniref:Uncharacterized protein n=1 Tax=Coprinopsis marcescibilis TaxID=230819 RepID=A0A5C3KSQ2_COPMA|nr:hypothetical protein FA15DRAFT_657216 [Coprinopsis marcescibilis]
MASLLLAVSNSSQDQGRLLSKRANRITHKSHDSIEQAQRLRKHLRLVFSVRRRYFLSRSGEPIYGFLDESPAPTIPDQASITEYLPETSGAAAAVQAPAFATVLPPLFSLPATITNLPNTESPILEAPGSSTQHPVSDFLPGVEAAPGVYDKDEDEDGDYDDLFDGDDDSEGPGALLNEEADHHLPNAEDASAGASLRTVTQAVEPEVYEQHEQSAQEDKYEVGWITGPAPMRPSAAEIAAYERGATGQSAQEQAYCYQNYLAKWSQLVHTDDCERLQGPSVKRQRTSHHGIDCAQDGSSFHQALQNAETPFAQQYAEMPLFAPSQYTFGSQGAPSTAAMGMGMGMGGSMMMGAGVWLGTGANNAQPTVSGHSTVNVSPRQSMPIPRRKAVANPKALIGPKKRKRRHQALDLTVSDVHVEPVYMDLNRISWHGFPQKCCWEHNNNNRNEQCTEQIMNHKHLLQHIQDHFHRLYSEMGLGNLVPLKAPIVCLYNRCYAKVLFGSLKTHLISHGKGNSPPCAGNASCTVPVFPVEAAPQLGQTSNQSTIQPMTQQAGQIPALQAALQAATGWVQDEDDRATTDAFVPHKLDDLVHRNSTLPVTTTLQSNTEDPPLYLSLAFARSKHPQFKVKNAADGSYSKVAIGLEQDGWLLQPNKLSARGKQSSNPTMGFASTMQARMQGDTPGTTVYMVGSQAKYPRPTPVTEVEQPLGKPRAFLAQSTNVPPTQPLGNFNMSTADQKLRFFRLPMVNQGYSACRGITTGSSQP